MQQFNSARRVMVDSQLRPQGVTDPVVLAAMARVERERFVPESARAFAYFDRSVPLGGGRSLMPPASLGRMLNDLDARPGERALVVGSGTGYAVAVLEAMGLKVTALESDEALAAIAAAAGIETLRGPLADGAPDGAPFDIILFDGAIEEVPDAIVAQLEDDGRVAAPVVDRGVSRLAIGRKHAGSIAFNYIADADVDLLPGFARPKVFTF